MPKPNPLQLCCTYQIEALFQDREFRKTLDLVMKEVMRFWSVPTKVARGFVLSAIGEPDTLSSIYEAWSLAKESGEGPGLTKVIIRRRVIDLLRKDARRTNHCALSTTTDALETDQALGSFDELVQSNPRAQLELRQVIHMVRVAVTCFATQGRAQARQAQLLQRYALDEANYAELSVELTCSENALRVRVHKAMLALRKHIQICHPDLEDLLGRDRRATRTRRASLA
jgi:DNA-directed RNA polymerase specialized sigma24 family protein